MYLSYFRHTFNLDYKCLIEGLNIPAGKPGSGGTTNAFCVPAESRALHTLDNENEGRLKVGQPLSILIIWWFDF